MNTASMHSPLSSASLGDDVSGLRLAAILRQYDTLHARDVTTHHVTRRDAVNEDGATINQQKRVAFTALGR